MPTVQIAVRLPTELLKAVDRLVAEGLVESRANAVRQGLEVLIDTVERARIDQTLLDGYRRVPPTSDEGTAALLALRAAITEEPW
ncbi:MAG TPA: ribbon-helix-helix domain-containing protein [Acidimicrobiia bacterium]|nr:ribbon-helix-helix domain-containing protein [Acidimicrobiia bacterium]